MFDSREHGIINFNSIKVRLEHAYNHLAQGYQTLFQFHKGTIRTDKTHRHMFTTNLFQFHKGTIRTVLTEPISNLSSYFNSIKVRLEPVKSWA